jgi:hypothetical protein
MIDVHFEGTEPARIDAIRASADNLLTKMTATRVEDCIWSLAESVWPALGMPEYADKPIKNSALRVAPLSRIGQMEGKSGSLVLIGFLADTDDLQRPHSHPVVIKTLSTAQRDKLAEEYKNALSIKPFGYDQKDNLAIPIFFDPDHEGFNVLWSIFSPSDAVWPLGVSETSALKVKDLREPLERGENETARLILETTFRLLRNLHHRLNKAQLQERVYYEEYERYLRGLDNGLWGSEWKEAWGTSETQHVHDACNQFVNPFWVLEQIRTLRKPMYIGAVHGDLHPGNIVLTGGQPRIIDFGWAQDGAHIAKDFVLMECNLRFHTVRPQLNQSDVYTLSDWIEWDAPIPDGLGTYARGRAELIQHLRNIAKQTIQRDGRGADWDWEYLVPLFLVALGLLRFAPQLGNQQAAVRFVLALSTKVNQLLHGR